MTSMPVEQGVEVVTELDRVSLLRAIMETSAVVA